jgi:hydroxylamine reductase (hybrid-cluster protein)
MVKRAADENIEIVWDRYEAMQPQCGFGSLGICCKICNMGPCRIDPFGEGPQEGVCGANADTIAARNIARMIAGGSAAHSDHGRDVAHTLLMAATDPQCDYQIKDPEKLKNVAAVYGIKTDGRDVKDIGKDVAHAALEEFGRQVIYGFVIIAMLLLGAHLYHGIWSIFQTLGFSHPRYTPVIKRAAAVVAVLITAGFISIPIAVMTGMVGENL